MLVYTKGDYVLFARVLDQVIPPRFWTELEDLGISIKEGWSKEPLKNETLASTNYLKTRISESELKKNKESMGALLSVVNSEWDKLFMQFSKPHLFIFTDTSGIVLEMKGSDGIVHKLEKNNIGEGTSFSLEQAGVNGISLAMEVQKPSLVRGKEHYLELFYEWSCVCQPIIVDGRIQGYLDLSTHSEEDFTWAFVLLGKLVADIEEKYFKSDPLRKQKDTMASMRQSGLSSREIEIAWRWLNNQSTLLISEELFISEGTVRNHIKKVYSKCNVSEKGMFMRKYM